MLWGTILIVEKLVVCRAFFLVSLYIEIFISKRLKNRDSLLWRTSGKNPNLPHCLINQFTSYNFSGVNVLWLALPEECTTSLVNFHKRRMEELWLFISSGRPLLPRWSGTTSNEKTMKKKQMAIKGKDKDKAEECFDDNNLVGCLFWQGASSGLAQQEKVFCPRLCILSQPFKIATWIYFETK